MNKEQTMNENTEEVKEEAIDWDSLILVPATLMSEDEHATEHYADLKEGNGGINQPPLATVTLADPLDIEYASALLPWKQIESFKKQASGFEIVTLCHCKIALSMEMQVKKLAKAMETKRLEITKPHTDFNKAIKKIADSFIDELKAIEASMGDKVQAFNKARQDKAVEIGVDLLIVDKVEDGCSSEQKYMEFEISKFEDVPKEYLKLDDKAVKQAISDGITDIKGLRIYETIKRKTRIK